LLPALPPLPRRANDHVLSLIRVVASRRADTVMDSPTNDGAPSPAGAALDGPPALLREAARIGHEGDPPDATRTQAARVFAGATRNLPLAEVREQLTRMLVGREVHLALQWLHDVGLLAAWLPEL